MIVYFDYPGAPVRSILEQCQDDEKIKTLIEMARQTLHRGGLIIDEVRSWDWWIDADTRHDMVNRGNVQPVSFPRIAMEVYVELGEIPAAGHLILPASLNGVSING